MKFGAIVVSTGTEFQEVLACFWQHITKDFQIERSLVGKESDIAFLFNPVIENKVFIDDGILMLQNGLHHCGGETSSHHSGRIMSLEYIRHDYYVNASLNKNYGFT
jgi:hypothetical protein